jgi:hypothetical protein
MCQVLSHHAEETWSGSADRPEQIGMVLLARQRSESAVTTVAASILKQAMPHVP